MEALTLKLVARQEERTSYAQMMSRAEDIVKKRQQWLVTQTQLKHWDQVAEKFREQERDREKPLLEIEAEKARLSQELKNLSEQEADINKSATALVDYQSQISNLQIAINDLKTQLDERKVLEIELASAQEHFADAKAEKPTPKS